MSKLITTTVYWLEGTGKNNSGGQRKVAVCFFTEAEARKHIGEKKDGLILCDITRKKITTTGFTLCDGATGKYIGRNYCVPLDINTGCSMGMCFRCAYTNEFILPITQESER